VAQIPYSEGVSSVAPETRVPDDYEHVQARPEQFGGLTARGLQQAGQGAEQASGNLFNVVAFQGRVNADDQVNHYIAEHNKILYGDPSAPRTGPDGNPIVGPEGSPVPDTGFLGLEGRAASDQRDATIKALQQSRDAIRKNLRSPQEQFEFDQQTRRMQADAEQRINNHTDNQWKNWAVEVNQTASKHSLDAFTNNLDNPEQMAHHARDYIDFRVKQAQIKFGDDPTIIGRTVEEAKRDLLKAQTDAVATRDPARALSILEQNRNIAGTQYDDMYGRLRSRADHQIGTDVGLSQVAKATTGGVGLTARLPRETASFFQERGGASRVDGLNPQFADRLKRAAEDYEAGNPGRRATFVSLVRTRAEQAQAYDRFLTGQGGLAAPPGQSRHEYGYAADIPSGAFLDWLHGNAPRYGLEFLRGHAFAVDQGHVQVAGGMPAGPQRPTAPTIVSNQGGLTPVVQQQPPLSATVTMPPAAAPMPMRVNDQPTMVDQLAEALQGVLSDPRLTTPEQQDFAIETVQRRFRVLAIAQEQNAASKREASEGAFNEHVTAINDMLHSPQQDWTTLAGQINHDPRLSGEHKDRLMKDIQRYDDTEQRLTFGSGYMRARHALFSAQNEPGHIDDMSSLLDDDSITLKGLQDLRTRYSIAKGDIDRHAIEMRINSFLSGAKKDLSFEVDEPYYKLRDPKGERLFNYQFLPDFIKRASELTDEAVKTGNHDKLDKFLSAESVQQMVRTYRPQRDMERDRVAAVGQSGGGAIEPPQTPLPPAPDGIDVANWRGVVGAAPTGYSHQAWGQVIELLHSNPTPQVKADFDKWFAGYGLPADKVLQRLGAVAPEQPTRPSHLGEADAEMQLTTPEKTLYQMHLSNLWGNGGVDNPDGSRSSLFQAVQEHDGRFYNIPTVWNGKIETEMWTRPSDGKQFQVPNQIAIDNVAKIGWDKFPSYKTAEEADERYDRMHHFMEKDTQDYQQRPAKPPATPAAAALTTPRVPSPALIAEQERLARRASEATGSQTVGAVAGAVHKAGETLLPSPTGTISERNIRERDQRKKPP
jgi:hypothetical protein